MVLVDGDRVAVHCDDTVGDLVPAVPALATSGIEVLPMADDHGSGFCVIEYVTEAADQLQPTDSKTTWGFGCGVIQYPSNGSPSDSAGVMDPDPQPVALYWI
jgi:hypothetical protein